MKDYIEALREIKKENKDFKITLSRKEVLELVNEFDRLNNIINELEKFINERIAILKEEQQEFKEDIPLSNWEEQQSYKNEILIRTNEIIQLEDTLDKLQALKGDSSNE